MSAAGRTWRRWRAPLVVLVVVLAVVGLLAALNARGNRADLDPDGTSPGGGHALAVLLRDRGVDVVRVTTVAAALPLADRRTTVFVPDAVDTPDVGRLAGSVSPLVVGAADGTALAALGAPVRIAGLAAVARRDPACALPAATVAGDAEIGGWAYTAGTPAVGCYPAAGGTALVAVPGATLVGAPDPFTNGRLAHRGDAALGLFLLTRTPRVVWVVPAPPVFAAPPGARPGVIALLPGRVKWAVLEVALGVLLLAYWRARRLGPLVAEPLPVVVRAAETVEGRGRLYRSARSRGEAADALRAAARADVSAVVAPGSEAPPAVVVDAVSARTGRPAADVSRLLYGADGVPPPDDAQLVELADALDQITAEVRRT